MLFPAYAGVILSADERELIEKSFPRIRGGDPFSTLGVTTAPVFSPHTRG